MIEGLDYSWSRPDPACLASKGMRFCGRYALSTDPGKTMTPPEVGRLAAAGLKVVTIHQPSGNKGWMLGGFKAGVAAATDALAVAGGCGMPAGRPVYLPLDIDPRPLLASEWDLVRQCLRGAASVLGGPAAVGIYGGWLAIERCTPAYAAWGYQTKSWSVYDGVLRWHPRAQLQQYQHNMTLCGGQIDYVRATAPDYGGWSPTDAWWLRPLDAGQLDQLRAAFERALR